MTVTTYVKENHLYDAVIRVFINDVIRRRGMGENLIV